jgi:hexulose-6-phosphate isomerase
MMPLPRRLPMNSDPENGPFGPISRRSAIGSMLAGAAFLTPRPFEADARGGTQSPVRRRYEMKKSINLWAFPYPQKMTLTQCLQLAKDAGFDGIELNYDLESDLSPKAGPKEFQEIRRTADRIGIAISGLCSFLFWP